ncbi:S41 family peptidase [Azospirillum isscasi]|uniref:S41 family peptidase n=1 Tax=Azospirillum isscasi TaxID=3053926 RepID=A0ABU0WMN7_9PROT|nr:S41 family peptidase [Azospirillum isscasi]MDQ2105501.1 S41 family peptidase [Azospirillum isscasi]
MKLRLATAAALFAFLAIPAGMTAGRSAQAGDSVAYAHSTESEEVDRFVRALRTIRGQYVEPLTDRELVDIAIKAMAGRDRYSAYLDDGEYRQLQAANDGAFAGLGIRYEAHGTRVRIAETVPESPAEAAGLRSGDVILAVDQQPVGGPELATVKQMLSGPEGAAVSLTVLRAGTPDPFEVSVVRGKLRIPSVRLAAVGTVGYIRIVRFDRQTHTGVSAAIRSLRDRIGPGIGGFVIDLRDNPGGLVQASVLVADAFLDKGTILTARGPGRGADKTYTATPGDETGGLPLVVLVNGRSASAAEILTGALKDHRRATVIGTTTFGKGIIQSVIPFDGGALKLTTARYYTPSGQSIHQTGIQPDETIAVTGADSAGDGGQSATPPGSIPNAADDQVFARALSILRAR